MTDRWRGVSRAAWLVLLLLLAGAARAAAQPDPAGRIIAVQGRVDVERAGAVQLATLRLELFTGDLVRTGPASRAAILLADDSRVKLNANSTLRLKAVAPRPATGVIPVALRAGKTLLELVLGELWLQTWVPAGALDIDTPAVTASIRGTELNLSVAPDGESRLALLEGLVDFRNPLGAVLLQGGELGIARVGQPPQKQVLLNPDDAVQWSLYYPGIYSFRDYPLVTGDPARLGPLLDQARRDAGAAPADLARQARVGELLHDRLGRA
ncbi:MAG: FecR domain-containing protein [Candidatus Rokubacteria bacterium]|nr:FecR domain-containing protein [Candidatus Rokubacteria bacterium]